MPETICNWAIGKLKLTLWATHASNARKFRYHSVRGTCLDVKCARCVGPRLRLYFFFFSSFSYFFAKLDKIGQNWEKLGKIEISLFCFPSFIFKLILTTSGKIGVIFGTIETNWELLGKIEQIWDKLGGFWAELGKFEKNWGTFG